MTATPFHSFLAGIVLAGALGGAVATLPAAERNLCRPGFARSQRLPAASYYPIAEEAYRRAGIPWSDRAAFRLDHIRPLCLGGTWDQDNLQIQTIEQAAMKDSLERWACRAYCAGAMSLDEARGLFHRDQR